MRIRFLYRQFWGWAKRAEKEWVDSGIGGGQLCDRTQKKHNAREGPMPLLLSAMFSPECTVGQESAIWEKDFRHHRSVSLLLRVRARKGRSVRDDGA